jgi:hypothetical protein
MAANEAIMRSGNPTMIYHTIVAAVPAGEVQALLGAALGGGVLIPHTDVAANTRGAYAIQGGVYEVTANAVIAIGTEVFWDDATNKISATGTGNRRFGYCVEASTGDGDKCLAYHQPA